MKRGSFLHGLFLFVCFNLVFLYPTASFDLEVHLKMGRCVM